MLQFDAIVIHLQIQTNRSLHTFCQSKYHHLYIYDTIKCRTSILWFLVLKIILPILQFPPPFFISDWVSSFQNPPVNFSVILNFILLKNWFLNWFFVAYFTYSNPSASISETFLFTNSLNSDLILPYSFTEFL